MRPLRWAALLAAGTATIVAMGATTASASASPARAKIIHNGHLAGYVAVQKTGGSVSDWKDVQTTFTVPAVNCSVTPNSSAYHYAALGGYREKTMQAAGIVEGCSGGSPYYEGAYWYSYYNGGSNGPFGPNDELSVNAGDTVTASVYSNYSNGEDVFLVADKTTGNYWEYDYTGAGLQQDLTYNSAGVFSYGNISNQGTADFGSVNFSGAKVIPGITGNKRKPLNYSAWKVIPLEQIGPVSDQPDIVPSAITSNLTASAFTNTWKGVS